MALLFLFKNRTSSMKYPTGAFRLLFVLLLFTEKISSEFLKDDNGNKYKLVKSESAPADGCLGQDILEDEEGNLFCIGKVSDPSRLTRLTRTNEIENAAYSECGRVNLQAEATNRILGGVNVTENKYPWVVSLQSEYHACTGSILSKTAILTAAHCDLTDITYHVVFGTNDNRQTKGNIKAKKVILHPDWHNPGWHDHDAMIVILEEPIKFTKDVGPICLPGEEEIQVGQDIVMTGWGVVESFDNLLKYEIVTPPLRLYKDFGQEDDIWRNEGYEDMADPKSYLENFRDYLLVKFKSVVPNFNDMFYDDFKILDKTKKDQSLVKFKDMLQQRNIESSNDQDILLEHYPEFLNWLLKTSDLLSEGLNLSMEWPMVNGQFQTPTALKNLMIALRERPSLLEREPFLKEAKGKTVDASICSQYEYSNSTQNLCVLNIRGVDEGGICLGDSGGPLAAIIDNQYVVVGIVSAAGQASLPIDCACNCRDKKNNYFPAVFQKTQTIMDWIKKTLQENDALPDN